METEAVFRFLVETETEVVFRILMDAETEVEIKNLIETEVEAKADTAKAEVDALKASTSTYTHYQV